MSGNYKEWYEEAIIASNELGFAGMSAADVINYQAEEIDKLLHVVKLAENYIGDESGVADSIDFWNALYKFRGDDE